MNRQNAVIVFLILLAAIMLVPSGAVNLVPQPNKFFYMTLPAPTRAIGALPPPTATRIVPPTSTPTMKICKVYFGEWVGPCE